MQNQKGNIGIIVSFVIVAGLIGFIIYGLINKPIQIDPLEGINKVGEINSKDQSKDQAVEGQPKQLEDKSLTQNKNMETNTRTLKDFTPVSKTTKLEKIDLVSGTGSEVKAGDTVSVHYTGAVAATGVIFQSSKDFGTNPITFPLSGVIKGWTDGIPGMKIGGTRRLVIPADMAYGANPPGGSGIPANADLVFDVELIAIK
jgi:FKBP-type peptidyl-prolyl cis-trans isomerase